LVTESPGEAKDRDLTSRTRLTCSPRMSSMYAFSGSDVLIRRRAQSGEESR
jgi:hypothetical protein